MEQHSILIKNIKGLVNVTDASVQKLVGDQMRQLSILENAYLLTKGERIAAFGAMAECPSDTIADEILDATERFVLPAWCDSHTHLVYAGSREQEFVDRLKGLTYEQITERGGGIHNSAKRLGQTSEDELYEQSWVRLQEIKELGTGAIEIKSGYGLSFENEMKMLRVIRRLKNEATDMTIKATFLGAHAIPLDYAHNRKGYIDLVTKEMIPAIAQEGLADFCDVFCEKGFFRPEETDEILKVGIAHGLRPKLHANELYYSGGIQVGVANNALSVDHLECTGLAEIECLMRSETMPTLLPATAFFLGLEYAPARQMIAAGLPLALATDYNPGSAPSGNMEFVVSLACLRMKMLPEEAIAAATLNGAYAMGVADELGSIAIGKTANILITKQMPSLAYLPYSFGNDQIARVILKGAVRK